MRLFHFYQDAVQATCIAIEVLAKKYGKPKMLDAIRLPPPELYKHVKVCYTLCFCFVLPEWNCIDIIL